MCYSLSVYSESNLQGEFYHACRMLGLEVALEVTTPAGRLDAVVLTPDRESFLAIVEVKPAAYMFQDGRRPQIQLYKRLGVPVYGLSPENDAHKLAATIKAKHLGQPGTPATTIFHMTEIKEERAMLRAGRKQARLARMCENLNLKP